jgi:hypothetical protein
LYPFRGEGGPRFPTFASLRITIQLECVVVCLPPRSNITRTVIIHSFKAGPQSVLATIPNRSVFHHFLNAYLPSPPLLHTPGIHFGLQNLCPLASLQVPKHTSYPSSSPTDFSPQSSMKRRYSDEDAQSRSDTSSHSMGNVADTEMDVGSNGPPGAENTRQVWDKHADGTSPQPAPPLPPPPTKKKRTRTLTTPHQSAVLHALLAQVSGSDWGGFVTNRAKRLSLVSLSYNRYARGSWPVDWFERSKGSGMCFDFLLSLLHPPLIHHVDLSCYF